MKDTRKTITAFSERRESSDSYHSVIVRSAKYRVIVCKDNWQWIIQRRAGIRYGAPRWDSLSYHRDRNALIRRWTCLNSDVPNRLYPELAVLPRNFRGDT